jgi:hypothetical protein
MVCACPASLQLFYELQRPDGGHGTALPVPAVMPASPSTAALAASVGGGSGSGGRGPVSNLCVLPPDAVEPGVAVVDLCHSPACPAATGDDTVTSDSPPAPWFLSDEPEHVTAAPIAVRASAAVVPASVSGGSKPVSDAPRRHSGSQHAPALKRRHVEADCDGTPVVPKSAAAFHLSESLLAMVEERVGQRLQQDPGRPVPSLGVLKTLPEFSEVVAALKREAGTLGRK